MLPETAKKGIVGEVATLLVGTMAGYALSKPMQDFGVDFDVKMIKVHGNRYSEATPVFQIQVKSSSDYEEKDGCIVYDLESKSYNDMVYRNVDGYMPLILIFMALKETAGESFSVRDSEIAIEKSLYWYRVESKDPTENKETFRIKIPVSQKLDVSSFSLLAGALND